MSILALETSCDDTCAAVIDDDGRISELRAYWDMSRARTRA